MTPLGILDAALARAEADLHDAAAGRALCRIDGSGGPSPFSVKRAEGARASLGDVRRAVRRGAGLLEAAEATMAVWRTDGARWQTRGAAAWVAYCEGGCASIEDLIAELRATSEAS